MRRSPLIVVLAFVPSLAFATVTDCSLTSAGYSWAPDLAGLRTPEQLAALTLAVDALEPRDKYGNPKAIAQGGQYGVLNISQSNGRETWTNLVRKAKDGTATTPPVQPGWRFINAGASKIGIDEWAQFTVPGTAAPSSWWYALYSKLKGGNLVPSGYVPFVTQAPAVALVRFWAVTVKPPYLPPADLEAWRADRRTKIETVILMLHTIAPHAVIELTGQDYPGYAINSASLPYAPGRLVYPWHVHEEDAILESIAREGVNGFRAITYTSRLTDGDTPRMALASASFPAGKAYPCAWFASDGVHLVDGVPGLGYDASARNDIERWHADPILSRPWRP